MRLNMLQSKRILYGLHKLFYEILLETCLGFSYLNQEKKIWAKFLNLFHIPYLCYTHLIYLGFEKLRNCVSRNFSRKTKENCPKISFFKISSEFLSKNFIKFFLLCLNIFFQISVFSQYKDFTVGSRSPSASALSY